MKAKTYPVGRGLLGTLEVLLWLGLIGTVIAIVTAIASFVERGQIGPPPPQLTDVIILVTTLAGVAFCRIGRAILDIAEAITSAPTAEPPSSSSVGAEDRTWPRMPRVQR